MSATLYPCDGCNETILPRKARIHCEECIGNHNVCANCYVVGNYTKFHREGHSTTLNEMSGYMPRPPPIPPRAQAAPSRRPVGGKYAVPPPFVQPPMEGTPPSDPPQNSSRPQSVQPPVSLPYYAQPMPSTGPPPQHQAVSPSTYQKPTASYFVHPSMSGPLPGPPPSPQTIHSPPTYQQPQHFSQEDVPQTFPGPPVPKPSPSPSLVNQQHLQQSPGSSSPPTQILMIDNSQLYSASPPPPQRPARPPPEQNQGSPSNSSEQPQITQLIEGSQLESAPSRHWASISSSSDQIPPITTPTPPQEGGYKNTYSPIPDPPAGPPPPSQPPRILPGPSGSGPPPGPPPGSPPRSQRTSVPQSPVVSLNPQPAVQSGWQPLFHGSSPTPIMVAFFQAVFACLDTDKDGLLTPEQYSAFLDVQGYGPDEDVWKTNHKDLPGFTADDVADFNLKSTFEIWSIQHTMVPRPNAKTSSYIDNMIDSMPFNASFAKLMKDSAERKTFSGGMMPMITLQGFIDISVIETVGDPSLGWLRVNRMAQHYNIWREWGDVPRSMLPEVAPADLVRRIEIVTEQARVKSQKLIDASAAEAAIKAQGRENALRLLDPPGTRYVYRY